MARLPKFHSEQEESDFWDTHDSTEYFNDLPEIDARFVDARPKTMISLRLQPELIEQLKVSAKQKGIGYQTLIRMWLVERLDDETTRRSKEPAARRTVRTG
jgi:predicted DNA binding CopG/RHH family protein